MNSLINEQLQFESCKVYVLGHAQGCRSYVVVDEQSLESMVIDCHLDFVYDIANLVYKNNFKVIYIIDTHTHADHPSGALSLKNSLIKNNQKLERIAHEKAQHQGVNVNIDKSKQITLGQSEFTIKYAPGHTLDHIVIYNDEMFFSGDTLLINGIARTDFLGGDAGQLFDSLHEIINTLKPDTVLLPGHDYNGKIRSTLRDEKLQNPWLQLKSRNEFIGNLTANIPPKPVNMDVLLKLNWQGVDIDNKITTEGAKEFIERGGASSIIDVRTAGEFATEHIENSILIPVDTIEENLAMIMAIPAPRLLMCQSGNRAKNAQEILLKYHIEGSVVIEGGMNEYKKIAGGELIKNKKRMLLERQVRIAAGLLILLGLGLSLIHQGFLLLSAFVGCGLIFAGITDYCGMAMLLLKMPWNKVDLKYQKNVRSSASLLKENCSAILPK